MIFCFEKRLRHARLEKSWIYSWYASLNITSRTQHPIGCKWRIDWFYVTCNQSTAGSSEDIIVVHIMNWRLLSLVKIVYFSTSLYFQRGNLPNLQYISNFEVILLCGISVVGSQNIRQFPNLKTLGEFPFSMVGEYLEDRAILHNSLVGWARMAIWTKNLLK